MNELLVLLALIAAPSERLDLAEWPNSATTTAPLQSAQKLGPRADLPGLA